MRHLLLTQNTMRFVCQASKRLRRLRVFAPGFDEHSLGWPLWYHRASAWPNVVKHNTSPQEPQDHQVIEEKVRHHDMAPLHSGVTGALYQVSGVEQLSADYRYTTQANDWPFSGSPSAATACWPALRCICVA